MEKKLILIMMGLFTLLIIISSIRLYNCARVDEVIAIKHEIRAFVNPEIVDEQIDDLEKRDYFGAIKYDIVEIRKRNEQNKEYLKK